MNSLTYLRLASVAIIPALVSIAFTIPDPVSPRDSVVEPQQVVDEVTVDEPVVAENTVPLEEPPAYSAEDLDTLALVIYQEAGADNCSDETRLMVGTVVLNRVADDRYPNTIAEVATEYRQYGRLYWTGLKWPERASKAEEAHAVKRAYDCATQLLEGYRALPEDVIFQAEFAQGTEVVAQQDGFYFCR